MNEPIPSPDREILSLMADLPKAVRCCRQDEVFCEDLTYTQFIILDALAKDTPLNMARLRESLSVDKSTTTRLVAPLIKRGLVLREKAAHDPRSATLSMTDSGREVHDRVWQCLRSFIKAVADEIPEECRVTVLEGARTFLRAMQRVSSLRLQENSGNGCCTPPPEHGIRTRMPSGQRVGL